MRAPFCPAKLSGLFLFAAFEAAAQAYPSHAIRMVVPWPPGGGSDVIARLFVPKLSDAIGQPIIIDNKSGANGNIGTEYVARSAPDGYTLLFNGSGTLAIGPGLFTNLPFDPVADFAPVSMVVLQPHLLAVHPSVPAKTVREFIAVAKSAPGKLNYASSGNGSLSHLAGEIFKTTTGVNLSHVPYKGAAPAIIDLIAGQVQVVFSSSPSIMPHVARNKLRALGVTTAQRMSTLPELPTVAEAGVPGFVVIGWYGLLAPAATAAPVVARLNASTVATLRNSDVRSKLAEQGLEVESSTPDVFGEFIKAEIAKYSKVVRSANIRID